MAYQSKYSNQPKHFIGLIYNIKKRWAYRTHKSDNFETAVWFKLWKHILAAMHCRLGVKVMRTIFWKPLNLFNALIEAAHFADLIYGESSSVSI